MKFLLFNTISLWFLCSLALVGAVPFNLSTQCRLLRVSIHDRQFNVQTKYCLSLLETAKIALINMAKEKERRTTSAAEIKLTGV